MSPNDLKRAQTQMSVKDRRIYRTTRFETARFRNSHNAHLLQCQSFARQAQRNTQDLRFSYCNMGVGRHVPTEKHACASIDDLCRGLVDWAMGCSLMISETVLWGGWGMVSLGLFLG